MKSCIYALPSRRIVLLIFFAVNSLVMFGQGFSPATQSKLQKIIDGFQNNPANPYVGGMSAAIKVDGLALWEGATGYAARNVDNQNNLLPGGTAFKTNTPSFIYSVTKTFTAALVLELAREGAFTLEDPISKFLPLSGINPALASSVTIRQLLAHESGFSDYTNELQLQIAVAAQPTHVWTPFEAISFVHQDTIPGALRRYSSTNYIILGAIIEAATGKHIEDLFRARFFDPLKLHSMYVSVRESQGNRPMPAAPHDNISAFNPVFQATGQPLFPNAYTNISRFPITAIASLAFTSGGIVSNVHDMAEWGSALFGGRATSRSTLNKMLNSIPATPDEDGDFLGYGVMVTKKISATDYFIGHDGNAPGYRSVMFYQPDKKLTLAILTNYHGADLYAVAKALYEALPDFTCGNKNQDNVLINFLGKNICVERPIASIFIRFGGAYLSERNDHPYNSVNATPGKESNENVYGQQNEITAFPNPFTSNVTFSLKLDKPGPVSLQLYDLNGKLVSSLFNGTVQKGTTKRVDMNGDKLPAGMYIIRLQTPSGVTQKKIVRSR